MYIYKAAVVGAGTMGAQIAQVISYSGLPVILKDLKNEAVEAGMQTIRKIYQTRVDKGKMTASDLEQKMALITGATDYDGFKDVDIVIEAAFEDLEIKKKVFGELDAVCQPGTILATNTSSISISAIGASTGRPEKVIGMHFFNPAHAMKLVEVIPGLDTASETVDDVMSFAESLRKIPVRVQECEGFLVNRLLMPYLNEAAFALQEGAANARDIDQAMTAFGMPMGPFTLLDMIGIDVAEKVAGVLYDAYGPRMEAAAILSHLVRAKRFGHKTGAGIYNYKGEGDDGLSQIIGAVQKETGVSGTSFSDERLLLLMVNEAALCLQEHVASVGDIDLAMIAGTGFPQDKGGPLHYADQIGLDKVLSDLQRFSHELGPRFWPAHIIRRMVGAGHLGVKSKQGFFSY
jgi:3-hydroxyacyl-CoA dehydrogenase/enoyl-CoA hydratase/3-hydroxybutyryl-CoA epimerase